MAKPTQASAQIEIAAGMGLVWDTITDIESWPSWNHDVRNAKLKGPVAPGTQFVWKAGPGTVTSTFVTLERPGLIVWHGRTMGVVARHTWTLSSSGANTVVRTDETWEGILVTLMRGPMTKALQKAIDDGLTYLQAEAERRNLSR
jgi:hypothetical protein